MNNFEWHGFAKFWLWFCLIVNILSLLGCISLLTNGTVSTASAGLSIIAEAILVAGFAILLFQKKKMGFYLVIGAAVLGLISNAINGNFASGIFSAIIGPVILYLVIKNSLNELD